MSLSRPGRIGYVVKRYPRYSETFIVNEILAHEAAGVELDIFSLRPPVDTHFQDSISRVRAAVTYLPHRGLRAAEFWESLDAAGSTLPGFWDTLRFARGEDAETVHQAALLAQEIPRKGITHLHAHFATSPASVAGLAARFAGISYSFTAHAKDIFHESVDPADLRRKLETANAAITVSDYNVRFLRGAYGPSATSVRRIYNGLDLNRFAYDAPVNRPPRIVTVGRLIEKKGFTDLVDACALLARRGVLFQCEIIGSGPEEAPLRARIEGLGLSACVTLPGPRPQGEIISAIQSAAVFAAPCVEGNDGNRDGLPTVLLEAMALGTACVSTPVTGIPEIVRDGETGLMVSQRDPLALATALERLLSDPELQLTLAARARRTIEAEFDARRNTAQLRSIFFESNALVHAD